MGLSDNMIDSYQEELTDIIIEFMEDVIEKHETVSHENIKMIINEATVKALWELK